MFGSIIPLQVICVVLQFIKCEFGRCLLLVSGNPAFSSNYKSLADAISGNIFTIGANGQYLLLLVTYE